MARPLDGKPFVQGTKDKRGQNRPADTKIYGVPAQEGISSEFTATKVPTSVDGRPLFSVETISPTTAQAGGNRVPGARADDHDPSTHNTHGYDALLSEDSADWGYNAAQLLPSAERVKLSTHFCLIRTILDQGDTNMSNAYAMRHVLSMSPTITALGPSPSEINMFAHIIEDYWLYADDIRKLSDPSLPRNQANIIMADILPLHEPVSLRATLQAMRWQGFIKNYFRCEITSHVQRFLAIENKPVIIASKWTEDMHRPISPLAYMNVVGSSVGNHVYVVQGWQPDKQAFRVLNSFGREWGDDARAWLEIDALRRLMETGAQAYVIDDKFFGKLATTNRFAFMETHPHFALYLRLRGIN